MGLVLWIDSNTFATGLLEKVFKKKSLPFIPSQKAVDFSYLIDDLRPELIVLDAKTALDSLEIFKVEYESFKTLPIVLVDEVPGLEFLQNIVGKIQRPFDPFDIPEKLSRLQNGN